MLSRSPLILLEATGLARSGLLQEMDREFRKLDRSAKANPNDTHLQKRAGMAKRRAGPPDKEHNWRFNGKGWFTRPQWNGGRCPPNSRSTQHNTCVGDSDRDKHQYVDTGPPEEKKYSLGRSFGNDQERIDRVKERASRRKMLRTPEVTDSPLQPKPGSAINWDHPEEPKIYQPHGNEKPRPLPDSPEHLPPGLARVSGARPGGWRARENQEKSDRITKHYVDKGYDPKFVSNALDKREQLPDDLDSLSKADLDKLPGRSSRIRALRKKGVKDERQRQADWETERQDMVDRHGPGYDIGEYGARGYDDYDDYHDDRDYDYDDDRGNEAPSIGGYKDHPGYPGHPDYPEFDGSSAGREDEPSGSRGYRDSRRHDWEAQRNAGENRHHPLRRTDLNIKQPGGQEPRWPRTGERQDPSDQLTPDQFSNPKSGRESGSSRTSGRSYMGGGRGRTNFRRRGGARR